MTFVCFEEERDNIKALKYFIVIFIFFAQLRFFVMYQIYLLNFFIMYNNYVSNFIFVQSLCGMHIVIKITIRNSNREIEYNIR